MPPSVFSFLYIQNEWLAGSNVECTTQRLAPSIHCLLDCFKMILPNEIITLEIHVHLLSLSDFHGLSFHKSQENGFSHQLGRLYCLSCHRESIKPGIQTSFGANHLYMLHFMVSSGHGLLYRSRYIHKTVNCHKNLSQNNYVTKNHHGI